MIVLVRSRYVYTFALSWLGDCWTENGGWTYLVKFHKWLHKEAKTNG